MQLAVLHDMRFLYRMEYSITYLETLLSDRYVLVLASVVVKRLYLPQAPKLPPYFANSAEIERQIMQI